MLKNWEPQSDFRKRVEAEKARACLWAHEGGRGEGREVGRKDGKRELLHVLWEQRFGALPPRVRARLNATQDAERNRWSAEFVIADSLEALFGRSL